MGLVPALRLGVGNWGLRAGSACLAGIFVRAGAAEELENTVCGLRARRRRASDFFFLIFLILHGFLTYS